MYHITYKIISVPRTFVFFVIRSLSSSFYGQFIVYFLVQIFMLALNISSCKETINLKETDLVISYSYIIPNFKAR